MHGIVYLAVGAKPVKRQIRHLLVARVELEREVLVGVKGAEMRAPRREFCLRKPELTNGQYAGKFQVVLPNTAVQIAVVIASAADSAAGNNALRDEMKRPRSESAGGAGQKRVLAELGGHVMAVPLPVVPV